MLIIINLKIISIMLVLIAKKYALLIKNYLQESVFFKEREMLIMEDLSKYIVNVYK
jgi:hypothetical protein